MAWDKPSESGNKATNNKDTKRDNDFGLDDLLKRFSQFFGGGNRGLVIGSLLGLILLWGVAGIYQLDQQERAVILRFGKFHSLVTPGLRWNPPVIDKVHKVNVTKVYSEAFMGDMLTSDENIVYLQITVQYRIVGPENFVLKVRNPIASLAHAMESALRHVVGSSVIDEVLTYGRESIAFQVQERLQSYMKLYNTGIHVVGININDASPPKEVKEAFDDVNKALEDEARYINEAESYANEVIPKARGMAKRTLEEAEAYRQQVIARAEGEASRFSQLLVEYDIGKQIMRERLYLETIETVLSKVSKIMLDTGKDSSQLLYLPLDQLTRRSEKELENDTNKTASDLDESTIQELVRRVNNQLNLQRRSR